MSSQDLAAAAQTPPNASVSTKPLPPAALTAASAAWDEIKDYPFDRRDAFIAGMQVTSLVAAGLTFAAAIVAWRLIPSPRAPRP